MNNSLRNIGLKAAQKLRGMVRSVTASTKGGKHERIKEELLSALNVSRPMGIEIPLSHADMAIAARSLLKEQPALTAVNSGDNLALYYRADLDPLVSREDRELLHKGGRVLTQDNLHLLTPHTGVNRG